MMWRCVGILIACGFLRGALAQSSQPAPEPAIAWATLTTRQQAALRSTLADGSWPIRVIGMLRLERYAGPEVAEMLRQRMHDASWQVRCIAIDQARRGGVQLTPSEFQDETDPHVIRAILRASVALPDVQVTKAALKLLRTEDIDAVTLGIELASLREIKTLRQEAGFRAERLITNMSESVSVLISDRLVRSLGLPTAPGSLEQWRTWLGQQRGSVRFPSPPVSPPATGRSMVADFDDEIFSRLLNYMDGLRQRDLDLVICMDATASMLPMVNQARTGVDSLILFLRDISRQMRLGFVAYRDHDNPPVVDGVPLTSDVTSVRNYLFALRITGGADLPEAVLDGLQAASRLKWNDKATRQIVVVGDAPPHPEDMYQVLDLLDSLRNRGVTVHAAHIPMEYPPGYYQQLGPERAADQKRELEQYNTTTDQTFAEIAQRGGGQKTTMSKAADLVPAIMHFTIEDGWWGVFDEFYARYLMLCR